MIYLHSLFLPVAPGHAADSCQGSETSTDDVISWSGETAADEGLEESQQMMDSLLLGAGTQLENERYLMGLGSRLQTALEKMLMAITDTTNQVQTKRCHSADLGLVSAPIHNTDLLYHLIFLH